MLAEECVLLCAGSLSVISAVTVSGVARRLTELGNIHIHINLIPQLQPGQENHQKLLNLLWLNGLTRQLRFLVVMLVQFSYSYEKSKDYFFVTNQHTHPGILEGWQGSTYISF